MQVQIQENISLRPFNSFGIKANARYFADFSSIAELQEILAAPISHKQNPLVLGGGTNILLTRDVDGLVIRNRVRGIQMIRDDDEHIFVKVGAGENWHEFVLHCIRNRWAGIENLSLIPGLAGASPMQNIGAYGVEIQEVFHELKAYHLRENCNYTFSGRECEFGYRDSIFKRKYKDQFVILSVTYKLRKRPLYNISYGALREELERLGVQELTLKAVSDAVINIRQSKLPDPAVIGNAGSFFKNPLVSREKFLELKQRFELIVGHENADGTVKLAAAWLIENCGPQPGTSWKGFRKGDAGCHERQALVLVNHGNASGHEIYDLSREIRETVEQKFGVILEREVNII